MGKRILIALVLLLSTMAVVWFWFLAPVGSDSKIKIISFREDTDRILIADKLAKEGLARSRLAAEFLLIKDKYPAGGYEFAPNMNIFQIVKTMTDGPQLLWVTVPPGWRKEQLAERLQSKFKWTQQDLDNFLSFPEGEYFPDTYLAPREVNGKQLAVRMHNNFNEKFAPYAAKFLAANIKNDTALKIASLLQRESGGDDMPLISGIIWNRLEKGMQLKIDATVQYARGKINDNWWGPVTVADYTYWKTDYNTYLHTGLPPGPIASTGVTAWEAVLNPAQTDCLYYLHDRLGQIHCSSTYEGHLENIKNYLQ